jgi:hypothetical protein
MPFIACQTCGRPMEVRRDHSGALMAWRGTCCGWDQTVIATADVYDTPEQVIRSRIPQPADLRWLVEIDYRTDNGTVTVDHHIEELSDLDRLVEQGPDWTDGRCRGARGTSPAPR